ncbi:MAG: Gfo/Idh/MocA family oxidoreductase [Rhodopirellula sp.]|nr:Gfo/Idh/MocA family oxidoreductase [Rhodopirellula sp.]
MKSLRCVVIGCGRMGHAHSERLAVDSRSNLVGFFDADPNMATQLRDRFAPDAAVFETVEDALSQSNADAAVICTPTTAHASQVRAAASCNLHVLCEKPLGANRDEILELIHLSRDRRELHFMLAYQRRFWAVYRRMKEEIDSGRWGNIVGITAVNTERWQQTIAGTWRDEPDINYGGFLGDAGSHRLDSLFYVTSLRLGDVSARSSKAGSQVEIVTLVNGELLDASDRDVPFSLSFFGNSSTFHEELFIHCENADLIVRDFQLFIGRDNDIQKIDLPPEQSGPDATHNPVVGFLELVTGAAGNISPFECALPVFDMTTSILESAHSRTPKS